VDQTEPTRPPDPTPPPDATQPPDTTRKRRTPAEADERHAGYNRRIMRVASWCAAGGAVLGVAVLIAVAASGRVDKLPRLILSPVTLGVGGFTAGMAVMCLLAPAAFLRSPEGRPWMQWIGTKNVIVAKSVCFFFGMMGAVAATAAGVLILLSVLAAGDGPPPPTAPGGR